MGPVCSGGAPIAQPSPTGSSPLALMHPTQGCAFYTSAPSTPTHHSPRTSQRHKGRLFAKHKLHKHKHPAARGCRMSHERESNGIYRRQGCFSHRRKALGSIPDVFIGMHLNGGLLFGSMYLDSLEVAFDHAVSHKTN